MTIIKKLSISSCLFILILFKTGCKDYVESEEEFQIKKEFFEGEWESKELISGDIISTQLNFFMTDYNYKEFYQSTDEIIYEESGVYYISYQIGTSEMLQVKDVVAINFVVENSTNEINNGRENETTIDWLAEDFSILELCIQENEKLALHKK